MAQCHDYLDVKMVYVETDPECNLLCELYLPSTCWQALGAVLAGITLHAPVGCQSK